jgi:glutamate formiminotransferase/formiminotetrahydrofolate cyclodeaminase
VREFTNRVSADAAVPGGGSVAALCGALGAGLAAMVGNLTYRRPEREAERPLLKALAGKAQDLKARLTDLVTEDSEAFEAVMSAMRLPKGSDDEKAARKVAMDLANERATMVPFETLERCLAVAELAHQAVAIGYEACLSDAGAAAAAAQAGAEGAFLNVLINLKSVRGFEADERRRLANEHLQRVRTLVTESLGGVRNRL